MNWVNALCDLYEKNADKAGKIESESHVLLPISHSTVKAQIEVTIDSDGDFIRANTVDKADALTIIPVTEKSAVRTTKPMPHPLCDNLKYISRDYMSYLKQDSKGKDYYSEYFLPYIQALEKWCDSKYAHLKAQAVYKYLKKSDLIKDLISCCTLIPDEDGLICDRTKIQNISQEDSLVRFRVESINSDMVQDIISDDSGKFAPEVWLDRTLQQSFTEYYRHIKEGKKDICYLSGEMAQTAELHPKKIRNEGDSTKLISANDSDNFTFRGRFADKDQAISVGYETSQKAHNALKWIIRKQGYTRDGLCMVVWESELKPMPNPFEDALDITRDNRFECENEGDDSTNYLGAREFNMALNGYKKELDNNSNMVIMAFDAATEGRLSITYYKELESSRYIENIKEWHESCLWIHERKIEDKYYVFEGMVSLKDIALALYGTEQNKQLTLRTDSSGKAPMLISTINRLLPCITDRRRVPEDIVKTAVLRASSTVTYEKYSWKKILSTACSLVKKYRYEQSNRKEIWTMSLDTGCHNKDYLYGRLLAIAERIEYLTFDKDDGRQTNAKRYMNSFSQRPYRTWKIIEERIQPYLNKLSVGQKIHYSRMLDEVYGMFEADEFSNDSKLDGLYLLGYHCQALSFRNNKADDNKEEKNDECIKGEN